MVQLSDHAARTSVSGDSFNQFQKVSWRSGKKMVWNHKASKAAAPVAIIEKYSVYFAMHPGFKK